MAKTKKSEITKKWGYAHLLTSASLVGLVASFWQAAERVHMLKNTGQDLSCNLSPVVDCGGVLNDGLAAVFGPPNAMIGMVVFSLLLAFGIQRLSGGKWTAWVRNIVVTLSVIIMLFALWFFWVSLYTLGKICIFCVFIWVASIPIGVYGANDYLQTRTKLTGFLKWKKDFLAEHSSTVVIAFYSIMIILFFLRFQDYYFG